MTARSGIGYADLVFETYQDSKTLPKFDGGGRTQPDHPVRRAPARPAGHSLADLLKLRMAERASGRSARHGSRGYVTERLAHRLDPQFLGLSRRIPQPRDGATPSPSHRFSTSSRTIIAASSTNSAQLTLRDLLGESYGDRERFYKMQPYIIALYTAQGHSDALERPGIRRKLGRAGLGHRTQPVRASAALGVLLRCGGQGARAAAPPHGLPPAQPPRPAEPRLFLSTTSTKRTSRKGSSPIAAKRLRPARCPRKISSSS